MPVQEPRARCQAPLDSSPPTSLSVRSPARTVLVLSPGLLLFKISFKNLRHLFFSVNLAQFPSKLTVNN